MRSINIPKYTLGEEIFNAISHGVGVLIGLIVLILTIIVSTSHNNTTGILSSFIYGISMIVMYLISCLYHSLSPNLKAKKIFRILDHCDIYLFIAGCYTPYCLITIGGNKGIIIFTIIWICCIIGILLNSINLEKFKKVSFLLYLIMGWTGVFSFSTLVSSLAPIGLILLISGGVVYSIGAILYLVGKKLKYMHSIFHLFILCASLLQFFSIYLYVL